MTTTNITRYFMRRPVVFWSLVVATLLMGVYAFCQMPKLEDPAVSMKQAMVVAVWPGATAHQVELEVAAPLEDELRTLPGVKKVMTECQSGQAMVTVEFLMTVPQSEMEQHFDQLRRKVGDLAPRLPQGCMTPMVVDDMMDVYGILYALTGPGQSPEELLRYAKFLRRELLAVKGVKRVSISGQRDEVINITLSQEQMARSGVLPTQIMQALQAAGQTVDGGQRLTADGQRLALRVDGRVKDEHDVADLYIQTLDGARLRLGDVARVERTLSEPQRSGFFVGREPALAISVAMEDDAIVPDVGREVDARLAQAMKRLPAGSRTEKIFFQPDKVDRAVSSFMWNLLESVLIVILVLIFTMGLRSGLIIGFGLVLTVALSLPVLLTLGTTLQRISLGAFIIAMGMLVDNAVVIMDGILVDRRRGLGPQTYLYRIGRRTAWPLLGATVIAASTFICVFLSPDTAGEYAHDLFLVLCVSLLVSWVLALVQVPVCAKAWLPWRERAATGARPERAERAGGGQVMNSPAHRAVRRVVQGVIGHKALTATVAVAALGMSLWGFTRVKNVFFPDFDYGQFVVECFFPAGTDASRVRDRMLQMSDTTARQPGVERVAMSQGAPPSHYCLVRPMTSGGDCYGELIVDCQDYDAVQRLLPTLRSKLRHDFPEAYVRTRKYNFSIATSHTVEAEFSGPDPAVLRRLSRQAEDVMRSCRWVDPYSVQNNWRPLAGALVARYDQQAARRAGIARSDVASALAAAGEGLTAGALRDQDRTLLLQLRVRGADGQPLGRLEDVPVWSTMNLHMSNDELTGALTSGQSMTALQDKVLRAVPLGTVAPTVELDWEQGMVRRLNGQRAIEAECDPDPDNSQATAQRVLSDIQPKIEAIALPEGYHLRWVGEGEVQGEAIGNLMRFVPLTLLMILGILLVLFCSWRKVALILVCFPFVLCGIVPALLAAGVPFTFMAIIGLMGLMGMMVKNAIVLVDEIGRLQREEHFAPYRAVVEATVSRVRPVLMASLTTILGMLPLLPDPMYSSMAITIMGGLLVGTLVTLVLLPLFYALMFGVRTEPRQ